MSKIPCEWQVARASDFAHAIAQLRKSLSTHARIKSKKNEKECKGQERQHLSSKFVQTGKLLTKPCC